MKPDELHSYLRKLQESPYNWPNDYFAWQKPDGSLFMLGIHSNLFNHVLTHELEPDRRDQLLKLMQEANPQAFQAGFKLDYTREYISRSYSIDPKAGHMRNNVQYDPVEELVDKVKDYKYLGTWRDPDVFMDVPHSFSRELTRGRWDLAKEHIMGREKKTSLAEQISDAAGRAAKPTHAPEPSKER